MEEYGSYKLGFRYRTRLRKNERAREGERENKNYGTRVTWLSVTYASWVL